MTIPMSEAVKYNRMRKRLERLEDKLEAVKTWFNSEIKRYPPLYKIPELNRLEKILEAED